MALIQGASSVNCPAKNQTINISLDYSAPTVQYLFSVEVFFAAITCIMVVATVAFAVAHYKFGTPADNELTDDSNSRSHHDATEEASGRNTRFEVVVENTEMLLAQNSTQCECEAQYVLLLLTASSSFLMNGFMPSLQTFSVLPYGQTTYYVTVCLYALTQPIASFLAFYWTLKRLRNCIALCVISWLCAAFLVALALMSPNPLLHDNVGGSIMSCSVWVIMTAAISYLRPNLAMLVSQKMSKSGLFWCGVVTQLGAFAGAILSFVVVNVLQLFQSANLCA
jgi:hypothetical protein